MRLAGWYGNRSLHWGVTVPLSWVLVHHVNMRTTVDVEASWDQGYATLYQYGFPLGFTHWGTASSAEYAVFLGPLLLDWLVYLLLVGLVVGGVARLWRRPVRVPALLRVVLWGTFAWTSFLVGLDIGLGGVRWETHMPVLDVRDPVFSLGYLGHEDGYGP